MSNLNRSQIDPSLLLRGERIGRDDRRSLRWSYHLRIRTCDIFDSKQRRYQAALHPFQLVYGLIVENPCPLFHIRGTPPSISNFSCHFFFLLLIYILIIIPPLLQTLTYLWEKRLINNQPFELNKRGFPDRNACMRERSQFRLSEKKKQALPPASTPTKKKHERLARKVALLNNIRRVSALVFNKVFSHSAFRHFSDSRTCFEAP